VGVFLGRSKQEDQDLEKEAGISGFGQGFCAKLRLTGADVLAGRDMARCDWFGSPCDADCAVHRPWTRGPWVHRGQGQGGYALI
jgi:hypothetical protein